MYIIYTYEKMKLEEQEKAKTKLQKFEKKEKCSIFIIYQ